MGYTVFAPGGTAGADPSAQRVKYTPAASGGRHIILINPKK
jgi:hypothetical protein